MTRQRHVSLSIKTVFRYASNALFIGALIHHIPLLASDTSSERMTEAEAIQFVDETISTKGCHFEDLLAVIETNENSLVVGLFAASNNIAIPPTPSSEYVLRVWLDRNTRQIIPSPVLSNQPLLTASNVVDIARRADPSFSYGTNGIITVTHLSETTIVRFPARKPDVIPPGFGWIGPDYASIIWVDNTTSNILFWLVGN